MTLSDVETLSSFLVDVASRQSAKRSSMMSVVIIQNYDDRKHVQQIIIPSHFERYGYQCDITIQVVLNRTLFC